MEKILEMSKAIVASPVKNFSLAVTGGYRIVINKIKFEIGFNNRTIFAQNLNTNTYIKFEVANECKKDFETLIENLKSHFSNQIRQQFDADLNDIYNQFKT